MKKRERKEYQGLYRFPLFSPAGEQRFLRQSAWTGSYELFKEYGQGRSGKGK